MLQKIPGRACPGTYPGPGMTTSCRGLRALARHDIPIRDDRSILVRYPFCEATFLARGDDLWPGITFLTGMAALAGDSPQLPY